MHQALKRAAERMFFRSGAARVWRALHRGGTVVLAYHNIVPEGEAAVGDRSLHLAQRAFSDQLDVLADSHEIVAIERLFERDGEGGRPRAVITFDDAYQGAVTAGVDELSRRGLPATIFVVPALLGRHGFWWDELADERGHLSPAVREAGLSRLGGRQDRIREWAKRKDLAVQELPAWSRTATEAELRRAVGTGHITLGSHGWTHPNLTACGADDLHAELSKPLEWLKQRYTAWVPWLAYPYGLTSPTVERAATAIYEGALLIEGGVLPSGARRARPGSLPRLNIPAGVSRDGFRLRLCGFLSG